MPEKEAEKSFFNTDFGKVLLGVAGFLAFTYFNSTANTAELTSNTMTEILKAVTEMSLKLEYNSNRITNLESSDASFKAKPRFTNEDDEVKLTPIRTDLYDIKTDLKALEIMVKANKEAISELSFKLREK